LNIKAGGAQNAGEKPEYAFHVERQDRETYAVPILGSDGVYDQSEWLLGAEATQLDKMLCDSLVCELREIAFRQPGDAGARFHDGIRVGFQASQSGIDSGDLFK
jgi:hypothetical protein